MFDQVRARRAVRRPGRPVPLRQRGFTLTEMLVVVAIIGLLTAMAAGSIAVVRGATAVNEATKKVVNVVEQARQFSASGREFSDDLFPSYGVAFDMTQPRDIFLFADCKLDDNDDGLVTTGDTFIYDPTRTDCDGAGGLVERVRISDSPDVVIRDVRAVTTVSQAGPLASIVYVRPDPTTWITDASGAVLAYGRIEVVVGDRNGTREHTINFWTSGLVDVQ